MFLKLGKITLALALGLGTMASTSLSAGAMPVTTSVNSPSDNIVEAQYMPNRSQNRSMQNRGPRCMTRTLNCRNYYRGYYYQTPWWTLPLIIGGAVTSHNGYGQGHARWCRSNYRSYDLRSNTYLGRDGNRHVCRGQM